MVARFDVRLQRQSAAGVYQSLGYMPSRVLTGKSSGGTIVVSGSPGVTTVDVAPDFISTLIAACSSIALDGQDGEDGLIGPRGPIGPQGPAGSGGAIPSLLAANVAAGNLLSMGASGIILADNSTGALADGFGLTSGTSGNPSYPVNTTPGTLITGLSSLVRGNYYYLGLAGALAPGPPSTVGSWVQVVGKAWTTTSLLWDPQTATQIQ